MWTPEVALTTNQSPKTTPGLPPVAVQVGVRNPFGRGRDRLLGAAYHDGTRITVYPDVMAGVPTIRGMGIPVATVVLMVADGMTVEQVCRDLPDLEPEDVAEALPNAAVAVRDRDLPLLSA